MDSKPKAIAAAIGALILSATAFYFGTGLHPVWWLTWLAPIPVLALSSRLPLGWAWLLAFSSWAVGALNAWHYDRALVNLPFLVAVASIVTPAFVFSLAVLLFRQRLKRKAVWHAALIVPAVWVGYEYVMASLSPHSTWGNLAYSQMDFVPILQVASITGIWGISFLVMLFSASIAALIAYPTLRNALSIAAIFATIIALGAWRAGTPPPSPEIKVGLVATNVPARLIPKQEAALPVFELYATEVRKLAAQGAQLIIIPEKSAVVGGSSLDALDNIMRNAARSNHVFILTGALRVPGSYNESRLYSPAGTIAAIYDKHHLVPQFEADEIPGTQRVSVTQPSGKWGLTICKDMDFPKLSRQYGNDGAGLLLVPAWDFTADDWLHGRMAILRGVESGFSIARSAKQGILSVSDGRGRVLAERNSAAAPFSTLLAKVPVLHETTLYARFGDWFAWLNLALLAGLLLIFR